MEIGFKTDTGRCRSNNEDACLVRPLDGIFAVADGVGGNNSGEVASRIAVKEIARQCENASLSDKDDETLKKFFGRCIEDANCKVLELSTRNYKNSGMATTMVLLYINGTTAYFTNIGDSRAYVLRDNKLTQITEDHTYVNTLVKAGVISQQEAEIHENKNMITKAVGADYKIDPDFFKININEGDILLLCTDGLYDEVDSEFLVNELQSGRTMPVVSEELVKEANNRGGSDNITVVAIKITEEDLK